MLIWSLPLESGKSRLEKARNPSHTWNCRQPYCGPVSPYQHPCVSALAYWRRRTEHRKIKKKKKSSPSNQTGSDFPGTMRTVQYKLCCIGGGPSFLPCWEPFPSLPFLDPRLKCLLLQNFLAGFPWKQIGGGGGRGGWRWLRSIPFENQSFFFFFLEKKH